MKNYLLQEAPNLCSGKARIYLVTLTDGQAANEAMTTLNLEARRGGCGCQLFMGAYDLKGYFFICRLQSSLVLCAKICELGIEPMQPAKGLPARSAPKSEQKLAKGGRGACF